MRSAGAGRLLTLHLGLLVGLTACNSAPATEPAPPPGNVPLSPVASGNLAPSNTPSSPVTTRQTQFITSDGAVLHIELRGTDALSAKPTIVEFSPYGVTSAVPDFGPEYNTAYIHARGTGSSTGQWTAVGPRDQQDIAELLVWACQQPWSNGHLGLYGFSASAIAIYNSLHLPLACVDAAVLMAGTNELYRDLLYPGGIPAIAPAVVVGTGVGTPIVASAPDRLQDNGKTPPEHFFDAVQSGFGILNLLPNAFVSHPTADAFWFEHSQRPGPNRFPVLADTGFFDVESRGPFQSYQMLRDLNVPVHLRVFGAHDGFPVGTPGPFPDYRRWFDRFLRNQANGIDREPRVQFLLGQGGYEAQLLGAVNKVDASDWPVPGTRWQALYLDGARGGGANSLNDGQLSTAPTAMGVTQAYPAFTSVPLATDPNTSATVTNGNVSSYAQLPFLTWQLLLAEPAALTYTTSPLNQTVDVVGPASVEVYFSSLLPEADIYALLADVWPDGSSHAVAIGRLRSSFPNVIAEKSLKDDSGRIVQPYADFRVKTPAAPGERRKYHFEFWPLGNRFLAGHRLRLILVGAPTSELPAPSVNFISVGADTPSRLLIPVLPGADLCAALGSPC